MLNKKSSDGTAIAAPVAETKSVVVEDKKKSKRKKHTVQYDRWGYAFIAPFFIVYIIFSLIPLLTTFVYSFYEYYRVGLMEVGPTFIGFQNFVNIFNAEDNLAKYFWNTMVMWIAGFIPQILVSLVLAVWFTNTELKIKCQQFFKTVIYMPNLIMAAAFSMLFFTLFSPSGPVNNIIRSFVDKNNIPDIKLMVAAAISQLKAFAASNPDDASLSSAINSVVSYLNSVEIPAKVTLVEAISYMDKVYNTAWSMFNDIYQGLGNVTLNVGKIMTDTIIVTAEPMEPIRFFSNAAGTRSIVAIMNFLMWYGNTTILLMAGVMGIDESLFEAARIDGASPLQVFFKITIPLLLPIFVYVLITSLIGGIQMFDVPQILSNGQGSPNRTVMTIIMKLNRHLQNKNYGPAGATSVLIFAITAVLSGLVYKSTMQQYQNKR
ncbi:MAG: sugar ABC transporter permease [Treponema sp.]|nr:sugar ABC transporter permease [Treponema sp.]